MNKHLKYFLRGGIYGGIGIFGGLVFKYLTERFEVVKYIWAGIFVLFLVYLVGWLITPNENSKGLL